jgi:hypothetical protein
MVRKLWDSPFGSKQACKVLMNSLIKWKRSCAYKLLDEILYAKMENNSFKKWWD